MTTLQIVTNEISCNYKEIGCFLNYDNAGGNGLMMQPKLLWMKYLVTVRKLDVF